MHRTLTHKRAFLRYIRGKVPYTSHGMCLIPSRFVSVARRLNGSSVTMSTTHYGGILQSVAIDIRP